jgi:hypothetical protein
MKLAAGWSETKWRKMVRNFALFFPLLQVKVFFGKALDLEFRELRAIFFVRSFLLKSKNPKHLQKRFLPWIALRLV